ncbi:hypothetical protein JAAARDRAFT_129691 [Jaapia argillacea MUCL 33604]|uniref:Spindle assembly checkpoint component MAD1 n=1 Tax=Jaapia argillacea MUCL 33604 TaxID=933084 RepID=A0A067PTQ6_9AGAM|nr:hypothetical protein JAAARDRAFT_129691 [Jaapia argillacea MUCL 33604]
MAHASLERQLATARTAKVELESKLREKDVLIERLERDRRWLAEREKEEREEKEKDRAEHEEDKRKSDNELRSLRASLRSLTEQHADLGEQHTELSRSTSQIIATQKSQLSTLERQVRLLEEEASEFRHIAEERSRTIQEVQDRFDELTMSQDTYTRNGSDDENWAVVREELHRQANYLRTLESSNAKLNQELAVFRERHVSIEVLREEKRGLEKKLHGAEELRERVVRLEAEVEASRKEREAWASKAAPSDTPSKTPVSVTQSLSSLRMAHARLLEDHGATSALLRQREAELADAQRRESESHGSLEKLQSEVRVSKDIIAKKDHKVTLAEREVGFLQALVASYSAEEAGQEDGNVDEAKTQHIQDLESLLAEFKTRIRVLEREIDSLGGDPALLGKVQSASEKHLEKIEELEQTLFELRGEVGGGRHVPPGIRVLSLRDNPAQQWADLRQEVMDRLKSENEALMKRLKELEESGAGSGKAQHNADEELVPRESWEVVNKEKKELEDVVKQKEKRLLRLQQVFASKSAEFREAIASILGLKFAFYPNGQVRVTSQYDLSASFVFQPTPKAEGGGAKMQLIAQGEGGPIDLPQMMQYWVQTEQCIPGFLASVTLECYDKWKREQQEGVSKRFCEDNQN